MPTITKLGITICAVGAALNLVTGIRTGNAWNYATAVALAGLTVAQWKIGKRQAKA